MCARTTGPARSDSRRRWAAPLVAMAGCLMAAGSWAVPQESGGAAPYREHCAACHGAAGKGDGPAAAYVYPKPRDFTRRAFRLRSTPSGEMPTDEDLMAVLVRGIPGTSMPSFGFLPEAERRELVAHVRKLAAKPGTQDTPTRVVRVGAAPACTPEMLKRGRVLYLKQGCNRCHAEDGTGMDPKPMDLKDEVGYWIWPNNFTRRIFKGGNDPRDIYLRFVTGLNGTPMASYEAGLSEEDRWALVHFVLSLGDDRRAPIPAMKSLERLKAARVSSLPADGSDEAWAAAAKLELPLLHMWQRRQATDFVSVRAVHDGKAVAIRLEWDDPTADLASLRVEDFPDAASVMLSGGAKPPSFLMGESGRPVDLWYWSANLTAPAPRRPEPVDDMRSGPSKASESPTPKDWQPVELLRAQGFGKTDPVPAGRGAVKGRADWSAKRWRVVFVRDLAAPAGDQVALKPGAPVFAAFAVWDGAAADRAQMKSLTYWQVVELE